MYNPMIPNNFQQIGQNGMMPNYINPTPRPNANEQVTSFDDEKIVLSKEEIDKISNFARILFFKSPHEIDNEFFGFINNSNAVMNILSTIKYNCPLDRVDFSTKIFNPINGISEDAYKVMSDILAAKIEEYKNYFNAFINTLDILKYQFDKERINY